MMTTDELCRLSRARLALADGSVRELRNRAGLKQADLAEAIGVDPSTYQRWETGETTPLRRAALRLADVLAGLQEQP